MEVRDKRKVSAMEVGRGQKVRKLETSLVGGKCVLVKGIEHGVTETQS